MQTVTETPFLRAWRQYPQLPIEAAYERHLAGEITYAEYRRGYADPEEAQRAPPSPGDGPMSRFRRKANHAHVYEIARQDETHVTLRSLIENTLPRRTFEEDYEPVPGEPAAIPCEDLAREALEPGTRWRHKKRGSTYEIVGIGKMQAENWRDLTRDGVLLDGEDIGDPVDMREVAVYRPLPDGPIWVRPVSEFIDGRFAPLPRTAYDAIGSGVKALEWQGRVARSVVGSYDVAVVADHFITYCARRWIGQFKTEDEAKAAAQADFERRVLSCLSTHTAAGAGPVGEAVAWLTECGFHKTGPDVKTPGGGSSITRCAKEAADKLEFYQTWDHVDWVRQTPLYAHPVEGPGEVERRIVEIIEPKGDENGVWCGSPLEAVIAVQNERDELRAALAETRERLEKERDEALDRVEELEAEGERVSVEFEKDCWIAMRALLDQCKFDWSHVDICGVQAEEAREFIGQSMKNADTALLWYEEQAYAATRAMTSSPPSIDAMQAILTVLSLDGGKRARTALTGDAREAGR